MAGIGFNVGDLVQLICGGPQMVVVNAARVPGTRADVEVSWFEARNQLRRAWLPRKALKLVQQQAASS